ncbi:MAG: Rne/Rng family ribonuclease [Acidobacteria bacterium]|nr:Rne/Rng family ribonuclease [Acidobacteriota bacterium]
MNKEMIVTTNGHEVLAAILEDEKVAEIYVERERQRGVVGNIYKGRVNKVLPGMQSAFVDIGLERDAFLYVSDVVDTLDEFDRLEQADGEESGGGRDRARGGTGRGNGRDRPTQKIDELLAAGQEILVQVVKEPLGTKGARVTSHVSVPGRFLVFMPTVDHVGVSRKIDERDERSRLRGIVRQFREEHGFTGGVIIRTAAARRSREDIDGDLAYFHELWNDTRSRMDSSRAPAVIHREESLVAKLLRDLLSDDFSAIRIDEQQEYHRVLRLIERIMPDLVGRVQHYTKAFPIFEEYGVQIELDKALRSKVWLKSGGYIVINHTEALVAIDVNTGRYVGKRSGRLEDTIVKTNLEAAREIVRQIRLRDLGGIIVLDFIDMEERKNRQKVYQAFEQELRRDRSPSKAVQVSDFGLIIATRKRVKQSLERTLTDPCPYCSGSAVIKSSATICYDILSELRKVSGELNGQAVLIRVNPDIARALAAEEQAVRREIERTLGRRVTIRPDVQLHHEQFDVMACQESA